MAIRDVILIAALLLSCLLSAFAEQAVLRLAFKLRIFDKHSARKIHHGNVPRLGGTVFFPVLVIVVGLMTSVSFSFYPDDTMQLLNANALNLGYGLCAAMVLFVTGLYDDLKGLRYRSKFAAQIVAGILMCAAGLWLRDLHGVLGIHAISPWVGWPLTIFAVVFITNAINFIDGIDGLAGSICCLSLVYYTLLLRLLPSYDFAFAMLAVSLVGVLIPFLWHNIHGTAAKRSKIFMGDTGSLLLGLVLMALGTTIANSPVTGPCHPMMVAFAPLLLPCFDVVRVVIVRLRHHHNPFTADKSHIHHCMLRAGFSQRATLVILLLFMAAMTAWSCLLTIWVSAGWVLLLDAAIFLLAIRLITHHHPKSSN